MFIARKFTPSWLGGSLIFAFSSAPEGAPPAVLLDLGVDMRNKTMDKMPAARRQINMSMSPQMTCRSKRILRGRLTEALTSCRVGLWLLVAAAAGWFGCATTRQACNAANTAEDVAAFRQIVVQFTEAVGKTMQSLDQVIVQANRDPRKAIDDFALSVHRLEVDSVAARARTAAMRARGSAYFEQWQAHLAAAKDERVRKLAEEHRDKLKQSFEQGRLAMQQAREVFKPFLSGLKELRAVLESNPTLPGVDGAKESIRTARKQGRQVQEGLEAVLAELNTMATTLRPATPRP
jgi:hypothetical protein